MEDENKELVKKEKAPIVVKDDSEFSCYLDTAKFDHIWRVATMFSRSDLVPEHYRGKAEDCMIVFNQAIRLGVDPMLFMQKTYVINKKLGIETQMAVALTNQKKSLRI